MKSISSYFISDAQFPTPSTSSQSFKNSRRTSTPVKIQPPGFKFQANKISSFVDEMNESQNVSEYLVYLTF